AAPDCARENPSQAQTAHRLLAEAIDEARNISSSLEPNALRTRIPLALGQVDVVAILAAQTDWSDEVEQSDRCLRAILADFPKANGGRRYIGYIWRDLAGKLIANQSSPLRIEQALREAITGLENNIADFPKVAETFATELSDEYVQLGRVYRQRGEVEKADAAFRHSVEALEKAATAATSGSYGMNDFAWFLATAREVQLRDPAKAREWAQKALAPEPTSGSIWNTLGVAQYRAGRINDSIASLEKSMQMSNGGDPADWFFLAMAHQQLGHNVDARQWYDKSVDWMD